MAFFMIFYESVCNLVRDGLEYRKLMDRADDLEAELIDPKVQESLKKDPKMRLPRDVFFGFTILTRTPSRVALYSTNARSCPNDHLPCCRSCYPLGFSMLATLQKGDSQIIKLPR